MSTDDKASTNAVPVRGDDHAVRERELARDLAHLAVRCDEREFGLLEGARPIDPVRMMREANADLYAPHYGAMDPELVEEMHAAGKAVGVWTVDDAAGVLWCRICKPDSVFTNRPREITPLLLSLD